MDCCPSEYLLLHLVTELLYDWFLFSLVFQIRYSMAPFLLCWTHCHSTYQHFHFLCRIFGNPDPMLLIRCHVKKRSCWHFVIHSILLNDSLARKDVKEFMQRLVLMNWHHRLTRLKGGNRNSHKVGNRKWFYQLLFHNGSTLVVNMRCISIWNVIYL